MNILTILELFGAFIAALGGIEGIKWVINFIAHHKAAKRKVCAEANREEVSAEAALRDMYESSLKDLREEHTERTKELRTTIADVNLCIMQR